MKISNLLRSFIAMLLLAMASGGVMARPGCVGKMWNPLVDLDFRMMGGMKVMGIPLMQTPSIGEPPKHKAKPICFCKDGLKTGFGLGLTFWLPSYINDVARQAGCLGFLNGINILPGFMSLSSGQEYNMHRQGSEGSTSMQIHWAEADVISIIGKNILEKCNAVGGDFSIPYMSEIDPIFQSDTLSVLLTPQAALLASAPMLIQAACSAEAIYNTLGGWANFGGCSFGGPIYPLSGTSMSKAMAQVTNMDITVKYLTRAAYIGTMLRTMGDDTACRPQRSFFYDPFQHRYQWSFPGKVTTRFNVDVIRWGMFIKDSGQPNIMSLADSANSLANVSAVSNSDMSTVPPSSVALGLAERVVQSLPKPLNYPTKEAGYMQIWEARNCCLMVLTLESVIKMVIGQVLPPGIIKDLYDAYNQISDVYEFVHDPIGGALGFVGDTIAEGIGGIVTSLMK